MTCRRICRELLSFVRFGELGPRSQPHLDHLAGCASCRDEVGYDREMVRRLRAALASRVEGMDPSPMVWERILRRAQAPDPAPSGGWLARLGAQALHRRTTTAMAGTALALVLALNTEIVSVIPTPATDASASAGPAVATSSANALRWARPTTDRRGAPPVIEATIPASAVPSQPEIRMTGLVAGLVPPSAAALPEPIVEVRVVLGPPTESVGPLADDDRIDATAPSAFDEEPAPAPGPAEPPAQQGTFLSR